MYWLDKLREFKNETQETYKSIAAKTHIPQTTIEKIFSGRTRDPKLNMIQSIADCLGHSASELLEQHKAQPELTKEERELTHIFRKLDAVGKSHVKYTLQHELERVQDASENQKWFPKIFYDFPVSAGTGEFLDSTTASIIELEKEPPRGTDYILRIAGDSMEPEFSSGDYIYVEKTNSVDFGEVGIFVCSGSVYMKVYTREGLKSLNPAYKLIKGSSDIQCLGRVLGTVTGETAV